MAMRVTSDGIDWQRLRPEDYHKVATEVTESAITRTVEVRGLGDTGTVEVCPCGRDQRRGPHYLDQLGREVCTVAAQFALEDIDRRWNNPMARALARAPRIDQFASEGAA